MLAYWKPLALAATGTVTILWPGSRDDSGKADPISELAMNAPAARVSLSGLRGAPSPPGTPIRRPSSSSCARTPISNEALPQTDEVYRLAWVV
jgi:hypothetical protein